MNRQFSLFLSAVSLLTRIPVKLSILSDEEFSRACQYYSLVGALIGCVIALILIFFHGMITNEVAVVLALLAGVLLTGGLHEDGLADTADGLGGGKTQEDKLRIMKDSSIGVYGVLALLFVFTVKFFLLVELINISLPIACGLIIFAHAISRSFCISLPLWMPYARAEESKLPSMHFHTQSIYNGWLFPVVLGLFFINHFMLIGFGLLLFLWLWQRFIQKQLAGYTGDILGASQQLSEVLVYLLAAIAIGGVNI